MGTAKREHTPAYKAQVALAAIRGDRILSQVAAQYHLHVNLVAHWLWRSVKYEYVYPWRPDTAVAMEAGVREYFRFYNHARIHQSLDYRTPAEVHQEGKQKTAGEGTETETWLVFTHLPHAKNWSKQRGPPQFGRTFPLVGLASLPGHVRHCQVLLAPDQIIFVPVACTDQSSIPRPTPTVLTVAAVGEFLRVFQAESPARRTPHGHDSHRVDSTDSPPTGRRRRRCHPHPDRGTGT